MREDNPATEVMNSLSACLSACAMLCLQRRNELTGQVEVAMPDGRVVVTADAERDAILDAVSWFIEAAPLDESPTVRPTGGFSKEMCRNAAVIAERVKAAVVAWDGTSAPPASLVSVAGELLAAVGMEALVRAPDHQGKP